MLAGIHAGMLNYKFILMASAPTCKKNFFKLNRIIQQVTGPMPGSQRGKAK